MMNMSIECDVKQCKYNHEIERYCTLNRIKVTDNKDEKWNHSDCASFVKR